jgi:hypothetical protein
VSDGLTGRPGRDEREVIVRARLWLIGAGLLVVSGCGDGAAPGGPALPAPVVVDLPASAAGGACALLDYSVIEQAIGVRFDVSAASQVRQTSTCVVRSEKVERPDLTLSVTATSADASVFKSDVMPSGSQSVSGLGKVAYRLTESPKKGSGPAVEIGWLSGDGRLIILRYVLAAGPDRDAADAVAGKLITLAKKIETHAA